MSPNFDKSFFWHEQYQQRISSRLAAGDLGIVLARAGVGKTAFLIRVALGELQTGADVLHIALGQTLDHVQARYETLFVEIANELELADHEAARSAFFQHRAVSAYTDGQLTPERLEETLKTFQQHLNITPTSIFVDGYNWESPESLSVERLSAYKQLAKKAGASLWFTFKTHRAESCLGAPVFPEAVKKRLELIDLAMCLEPEEGCVLARLLKMFDEPQTGEPVFWLVPSTMRPLEDKSLPSGPHLTPKDCILFSGAHSGAETEFGSLAEKYKLVEKNFSFSGRDVGRKRGLVILKPDELRQGEVSQFYLQTTLKREFSDSQEFKKVLQTIWHQVNPAQEVFAVGLIQHDKTVKGGTGWAVELAKQLNKPVHVYDQSAKQWFTWKESNWTACDSPRIQYSKFVGTGTSKLNEDGKKAIAEVFLNTFGQLD